MLFNKKYKNLREKIERLDYSLYLQIEQYVNRADTKYHKGRIDGLISARGAIQKILDEEDKRNVNFTNKKRMV